MLKLCASSILNCCKNLSLIILKGELSSKKKLCFLFFYMIPVWKWWISKKIQVNCLNRSKVLSILYFSCDVTPRKCTGLCSLSDKESIFRTKGHGTVKLTWLIHCGTTKWFLKISEVFIVFVASQGVKRGERFQNGPKHPILIAVCPVKLEWRVHVRMTNSLLALWIFGKFWSYLWGQTGTLIAKKQQKNLSS